MGWATATWLYSHLTVSEVGGSGGGSGGVQKKKAELVPTRATRPVGTGFFWLVGNLQPITHTRDPYGLGVASESMERRSSSWALRLALASTLGSALLWQCRAEALLGCASVGVDEAWRALALRLNLRGGVGLD
jgi:hypothetical protein